jgi:predicted metal-binding protein
MATSRQHKITVSTDCRFTGGPCRPGAELLAKLNRSVSALGRPLDDDFAISGTVCMAACSRPCTIAFQASGKATYLFGDVSAEENIEDLVTLAAAYAGRAEGGKAFRPGSSRDAEPAPASHAPFSDWDGTASAFAPAAVIVSEAMSGHFQ